MKVVHCEVSSLSPLLDDQPVLHLVIQYADGRCVQYSFGEGDLRDYKENKEGEEE